MGEVWKDCAGEGKVKEIDHTYLAILVFCPRDLSELLIVQHWSAGNIRVPLLLPVMRHCCLGKFISRSD